MMVKPAILDEPPGGDQVTDYDLAHRVTYLRLLDAVAAGADVFEVARIVLGIDGTKEPQRARRAYETHIARARWMSATGYRQFKS